MRRLPNSKAPKKGFELSVPKDKENRLEDALEAALRNTANGSCNFVSWRDGETLFLAMNPRANWLPGSHGYKYNLWYKHEPGYETSTVMTLFMCRFFVWPDHD